MIDDTCGAPGCESRRYLRNRSRYCNPHRWRLKRYGSFEAPIRALVPYVETNGYVKVGHRYVHREVLFAKIGDGEHPCNWCGRVLTWGLDLLTDHVDGDKLNNEPSNLVPACNPCNVRRGKQAKAPSHCKRGHEFTSANTYIIPTTGSRQCRICSSAYKANWQRIKRASRAAAMKQMEQVA